MDSNARWHRSDCSKPNVIVEDGVPYCQSCHETSLVFEKRLVEENRAKGGDIQLPEATPLGKANLWWPPSVPYRSPKVDVNMFTDSCNDDDGVTAMLSVTNIESTPRSPIYPSSLGSNHFRLIYLSESEDVLSPIHFRLEEYAFSDHPEYETVSYVWGGENCDSTLCKPVYVGRFWDVILATANCSALLHYLRHRKVCRVIWVDAICINQADNTEKPAQVSRMSDIYSNCERVVAFLGEDLVSSPAGRTHRSRIDLQKSTFTDERSSCESNMRGSTDFFEICANGAGISQDQLFERRYLTRIWIVQELLLSKKAIFPLGDLDILCGPEEAMHLILRSSGERLHISAVKRSLSSLLQATSHCQASDPRDRIYGLLGLFEPQNSSQDLISNYTLSWRDCWMGTAAYLLLVERNLHLLTHALGNNRPAHLDLPSWVPDIVNTKTWKFAMSWSSHLESIKLEEGTRRPIVYRSAACEKWVTEFVMYSGRAGIREFDDDDLETNGCWEQQTQKLVLSSGLYTGSLESATVGSSNGALRLQALRIFDSPCRLTTETEENELTSIWVRGPSTAAHFRTIGLKRPVALDETYQLFIFCEDSFSGSHPILLALTTALSENNNKVVAIHDCCIVYDIHFYSMDHIEARTVRTDLMTNSIYSLGNALWLLREFVTDSMIYESKIFGSVFPSDLLTTRDFLILVSQLASLSDESPALAESISAVAGNICPEFDPVVRDNYFHLTIKNEEMWRKWATENLIKDLRSRLEVKYSDPLIQDKEEWSIVEFDENDSKWVDFWDKPVLPVTLRISLDLLGLLFRHMKTLPIFDAMCRVREFSIHLDEDIETLMFRKPRIEDCCVFMEGWGQGLLDELGLVWKLERITIM